MPVLTQNHFHVLIRGIPPGNDKEDVEKHILEVLGARSVVHDVVPDPESATYCTTVSFLVPPNDKGDYILSSLNYTKFRSLPQEIHLDRDFYGLTPLADEPGSAIEYAQFAPHYISASNQTETVYASFTALEVMPFDLGLAQS